MAFLMKSRSFWSGGNSLLRKDDLRAPFDKYGKVEDVYIPRDRYSGNNKGFGFVRYAKEAEANDAVNENGKQLMGQEIHVEFAGKRPPRRR